MDAFVSRENHPKHNVPFFYVLLEFCSFYALRTLSTCCSVPFDEATQYRVPHTPKKGMYVFISFYALRTLSPCCSLPLDEATHYGALHMSRKGVDALLSFNNHSKSRVLSFSHFARVLLVSRSKGLLTLLCFSI